MPVIYVIVRSKFAFEMNGQIVPSKKVKRDLQMNFNPWRPLLQVVIIVYATWNPTLQLLLLITTLAIRDPISVTMPNLKMFAILPMLTLLHMYFLYDFFENWLLTIASCLAIFSLGTLSMLEAMNALFNDYRHYLTRRRKLKYCEVLQVVRDQIEIKVKEKEEMIESIKKWKKAKLESDRLNGLVGNPALNVSQMESKSKKQNLENRRGIRANYAKKHLMNTAENLRIGSIEMEQPWEVPGEKNAVGDLELAADIRQMNDLMKDDKKKKKELKMMKLFDLNVNRDDSDFDDSGDSDDDYGSDSDSEESKSANEDQDIRGSNASAAYTFDGSMSMGNSTIGYNNGGF